MTIALGFIAVTLPLIAIMADLNKIKLHLSRIADTMEAERKDRWDK